MTTDHNAADALVDICLPIYNTEKYLRLAIESVFHQSNPRWRLLISDNASTDKTWEIVNEYRDPRVHTFQQERNLGAGPNWQFLLSKVEAPYFCFLAGDDYFFPQHLDRKVTLLQRYPNAPFVHGVIELIDAAGKSMFINREQLREFESSREVVAKFFTSNFVNVASTVFRTDSVQQIGMRLDLRYSLLFDWQLFMLLTLFSEGIVYDHEVTSVYRFHAESVARQTEGRAQWLLEEKQLQVDMLREYPSRWEACLDRDQMAAKTTSCLWRAALREWRAGRAGDAKKLWALFAECRSVPAIVNTVSRQAIREAWERIFPRK